MEWHLWVQRTGLAGKAERMFGKGEEGEEGREGKLGVGQKVKMLTWERLTRNREVVGRWQEVSSDLLTYGMRKLMDIFRPWHSQLRLHISQARFVSSLCSPMRSGSLQATPPWTHLGTRNAPLSVLFTPLRSCS